MNAKEKAFRFYLKSMIEKLPFKWVDGAISNMLGEKQEESTERIKDCLDIAILEAKKEVFDDMDKILHPFEKKPEPRGYPLDSYTHKEYEKLKKEHLEVKNA